MALQLNIASSWQSKYYVKGLKINKSWNIQIQLKIVRGFQYVRDFLISSNLSIFWRPPNARNNSIINNSKHVDGCVHVSVLVSSLTVLIDETTRYARILENFLCYRARKLRPRAIFSSSASNKRRIKLLIKPGVIIFWNRFVGWHLLCRYPTNLSSIHRSDRAFDYSL